MVYNLAAVGVAASLLGCTNEALQGAIDAFDPQNGRLQTYDLAGRRVLLNLAKNPTGFNQNLKIVAQDPAPKVVAFFINDKEADGRDVSWLWDIDFEELAQAGPLVAYAGGIRSRDMAVRLKYAGIAAEVLVVPALSIGRYLFESKLYLETTDLFAWTIPVTLLSLLLERLMLRLMALAERRHPHPAPTDRKEGSPRDTQIT